MPPDAAAAIEALGLLPHPEGGWYTEHWRAPAPDGGRSVGTAIYYLLAQGERSAWHRIDATEIWHFYDGDALELSLCPPDGAIVRHRLGRRLALGERPQIVVPPGWWQAAVPIGSWSLVGCTVSPAFSFDGFELAPEGFEPG